MIWLDQPIGVGYSYGASEDANFNGTNVGENLYWFLQGFIEKHPEFDNREFFLSGESYGGHYVLAGAHYIMEQNKLSSEQPGSKKINLQGIAIGNGWVNPVIQYNHTIDMAEMAKAVYNISLLNDTQKEQMIEDTKICIEMTEACLRVPPAGICYGMDYVRDFFNLESVREYLNVADGPVTTWVEASDEASLNFEGASGDYAENYEEYVADLLDAGFRVLIYIGDADLMCNWQGNEAWTSALQWSGKASFNTAEQRSFITNDPLDSSASPLDAGLIHMVPSHQPAASLDMINEFFKNQEL